MIRLLVIGLTVLCLHPAHLSAQTAPDRLDVLQSEWHARQADLLLRSGDRAGAILQALRGIPVEPKAEDEATYQRAFDALYRGVVSGAFTAPMQNANVVEWSADGARAVSSGTFGASPGQLDTAPLLWDTQSGQVIARLQAPAGDFNQTSIAYGSEASPFSPDGRFLAIARLNFANASGGVVSVYDGRTGAPVTEVQGGEFYGFSRNGTLMVVGDLGSSQLQVYDTATWSLLQTLTPGQFGADMFWQGFTAADDAVFVFAASNSGTPGGVVNLVRIDASGARTIVDLSFIPGLPEAGHWPTATGSLDTPHFLMMNQDGRFRVFRTDGQLVGEIEEAFFSVSFAQFVRGGTAVALATFGDPEPSELIRVFSLTGERLPTDVVDERPFLDWVTTESGVGVGLSYGKRQTVGPGPVPGVALYNQVWPEIPAPLQEQIAAERIQRSSE